MKRLFTDLVQQLFHGCVFGLWVKLVWSLPSLVFVFTDKIQQSADSAQFITTTFRPELLDAADKFYGVRFRHKVSSIEEVSRADAQEFVTEQGEDAQWKKST